MRNNNKQLRYLGLVLIALVIIFSLMTATAQNRSQTTFVEKAIATVLYPLQLATDWVAGQFNHAGTSIAELAHLREENATLRQEVQQATQLTAQNQLLTEENNRLRGELDMKQHAQYQLLTAEVISRTPDNWYRTVIINRGSRDGVKPNMAVVNWQGLVGKISQTTPFTATVQLVTDAGFGAGAKLPSGELGYIQTVQGGNLRMNFFSSQPAVQLKVPVVTSGQGVMPPDLLIGYTESFDTSGSAFDKFITIRPAVDFNKLDVVHVVLETAAEAAPAAPEPAPKGAKTP